MEYLGTMFGHGKPITRKGTKKSGLGFTAECKEGKAEIRLRDVEGTTKIEITVNTNDNKSYTTIGSFTDFCNEVHRNG